MYQSFYTGALGAGTCMAKMSILSNNLSNINNTFFKPKTAYLTYFFHFNLNDSENATTELQAGNGVRMQRTYTNFDTTSFRNTNSDLDYAIHQPNQFFMVQNPTTGEITYTRTGHFYRSERADGFYLATDAGKLVLDQNGQPIRLRDPKEIAESQEDQENQDLTLIEDDEQKVSLYTFTHPSRLLSVGDNEFAPPEGMAPILVENPEITQGAVESSGTDLAKEMTRIIECQRAYSYALRMVTTSDEIESTINSLRG